MDPQRILAKLGHIRYYVHDKSNEPLVVVDDDISETFQFVRALEEHGISNEITSKDIGRTGSCQTNGKPVSEQMGAQILTDGWGIVSPGNPLQAAKLARAAGSVSHDGESNRSMPPNGGLLWRLKPLYRETLSIFWIWGCLLFHGIRVVGRVREWAKDDGDWLKTRKRIEDSYEYDKFRAMHIINTCAWDTDCNSGNVGCLVAIMLGLTRFEGKYDWRGPLVDRVLLFTAEVGYSINNAARIAIEIANMGRRLAGHSLSLRLPGSVQGFQVVNQPTPDDRGSVTVRQDVDLEGNPSLAIHLDSMNSSIEVSTPVFGSLEELTKSLNIEPGSSAKVGLRVQAYGENDSIKIFDRPSMSALYGRVGLCIQSTGTGSVNGTVWLDSPRLDLRRPFTHPGQAWHHHGVNNVSKIHPDISSHSLVLSQSHDEGIAVYGARDWTNYRSLAPKLKVNMGAPVGVAGRRVALVKAKDEQRITLSSVAFDWSVDGEYDFALEADGTSIRGRVQGVRITASDDQYSEGGIGLVIPPLGD
ncbi:hypothetical protein BDW60DRAFT_219320 [Aspergillus nidulans var. acristatus]